MEKPLRILAVVNVPWDPRLGAARVWIELTDEWRKAGHQVEKFCLTDAFPEPASSGSVCLRPIRSESLTSLFQSTIAYTPATLSEPTGAATGSLV